ncbi:hypothetical protein FHR92_000234 [Fontibacillus solani]|uniref:Uncharacterized protein n=1 Tax=Fontibacillus solani TaxID=1572857 RepID=A0A7W3SPD9_9BACL|nr:hypothetical protein [Fontibacillus solani]
MKIIFVREETVSRLDGGNEWPFAKGRLLLFDVFLQ